MGALFIDSVVALMGNQTVYGAPKNGLSRQYFHNKRPKKTGYSALFGQLIPSAKISD
jgi:hypothetical protein